MMDSALCAGDGVGAGGGRTHVHGTLVSLMLHAASPDLSRFFCPPVPLIVPTPPFYPSSPHGHAWPKLGCPHLFSVSYIPMRSTVLSFLCCIPHCRTDPWRFLAMPCKK